MLTYSGWTNASLLCYSCTYIPHQTKSYQRIRFMPVYCVTELLSHYCVDGQHGRTTWMYLKKGEIHCTSTDILHTWAIQYTEVVWSPPAPAAAARCLRCQLTYLLLLYHLLLHTLYQATMPQTSHYTKPYHIFTLFCYATHTIADCWSGVVWFSEMVW